MPLGKIKRKSEESFSLIEKTTREFSITISQMISESKKIVDINLKLEKKIKENMLFLAEKLLSQQDLLSGAGFALYNESTTRSWEIAWLYRPQSHRLAKNYCLNKASQHLVDYQTFSWFSTVKETKEGYLHGPYVDYVCNSTYTLTYLYPVYFDKQLIGVAAADVMVGQLERILRDTLANERLPIVMTTPSGRIFFSNLPNYRVGELKSRSALIAHLRSQYFTLWDEDSEYGAIPP
ncbi:hypothetical protein SAMN05216522_10996 [Rosenbergiella nectarea]|uniref:Cache domain-containing protein n=2 Tax=Rosenbergiella nectarea TaxID=988801 RepID=A0A1H9KFC5_9GAMM|nr:hypothetical protein SAMN05216522_10996 [Rosenbergiella nectarea]